MLKKQKSDEFVRKRVGKLTVKSLYGGDEQGDPVWECECDCGNLYFMRHAALLRHLRKPLKARHLPNCGGDHRGRPGGSILEKCIQLTKNLSQTEFEALFGALRESRVNYKS